ncbi:hypothetical protein [Salinarimonas soli]|uniref:Peptidase inhibitor family I36 protein n=1 Tax=Salinarimonas soli TaxID=1638099 RepID=A0A5B2VDR6_9HYPH|nr:hypothetical protein [Salinarimonas soli]KAA2236257.1 hypothetical protein F0L46_16245 [Salinarimonas soli]
MDQQSSVRAPFSGEPSERSEAEATRIASNPFILRASRFSSPVAMALGLLLLAVMACGIALGGLILLAGDGRTTERVGAGPQLAAALQVPPRAWSEAPAPVPPLSDPLLAGEPLADAAVPEAQAAAEPQAGPAEEMPAVAEAEPAYNESRVGEIVEGIPLPPRRAVVTPAAYAGVWAPDAASCSPRQNRKGLLPAVINPDGAWAGETSCVFESGQKAGSTWRFSAVCSNARRKWRADVKLTVTGDRLVWASQRGSQAYVRCTRDT